MPPPPPWPSASAMATRVATHWIADTLARDESIEFSVLQALLRVSSEPLAGAPEATREGLALRTLQELSSLIPAGGDAAATAGLLRVDGARSCEDVLFRLATEVESSEKLEKDLLPPFSQDIQETIRTTKLTLPETSFQLLKGVDSWITSMRTMISQPNSREAHPSALQHERGCNGANQESKSETNLQPGTAMEDRIAFEEQNADKSSLEVSGANKAYQALDDDGSIMKNDTVHGGLTMQTAPVSQNCNVTLHDKSSEANCFSEQKNEKNGTDVQKDYCCTSIPSSSMDRDRESAKKTPNEEKSEDNFPEISVRSKDQNIVDSLEGLSQEDLCIKRSEDGQLLKCSDCSVGAHDSCFASLVTFEETNLFYCPVCFHKRAKETYEKEKKTYCEAREKLVAYLGRTQVRKQHDEQLNGVQPGAANRDGHSNGFDTSKRNSIHQNEAYDLAHRDEEPHQPRKKQKINARGNDYPKEVLTEKVPFQNSGPASMNKHPVLQNNSKTRVEDPERKKQAGDKEAHKEAGNASSSHETLISSQRGCDPHLNQDKKRLQEKESALPCKSGKGIANLHQHMPTLPRVRLQKRYSKRVASTRRRGRMIWTEAEEAVLREAMEKFASRDVLLPWSWILEYGHHVFHKRRVPDDLRVKWRNLKKEPAGH